MAQLDLITASDLAEFDLVVVGAVSADPEGVPTVVAGATGWESDVLAALGQALAEVGGTGKVGQVHRLPGRPFGLPAVLVVGLGSWPEVPSLGQPELPSASGRREALRRAAGAALLAAKVDQVALALPATDPADNDAAALGALLGSYRYPARRLNPAPSAPQRIGVLGEADLDRVRTLGQAVNLTRELVDTPPGDLPPAALAQAAVAALADAPVTVEVLGEPELREGGYGGIIAVGQGSANPPRLVRLTYSPEGAGAHLALVGKGITFDSGGLSLKPPAGMITMKCDMAGAAAVLGAVQAVARLAVPVRVTAYLACAENMPSGAAQRPGDVITAYGGRTVEVLNTDAEGRLVMMDAIVRAGEDSPDYLVDVATLTGAQVIALGARIAGVMGNDEGWRDRVVDAAGTAGELAWPMPVPDELRNSLDSPVADLANVGEKNGGMLTAASFLREFVPEGLPWAHVDIAGPAFNESAPWAYNAKGATGYAVRTLVALAESLAAVPG